MDDIVELVKQRNLIEDVIQDTFPLQRQHGRYLRAKEHDSLVIDTGRQMYTWNSKGEGGDVIDWMMKRGNLDFKSAVEQLCRRANLPEPRWGREETDNRNARRSREDVYRIAVDVMVRWLWNDADALAYCRARGWTDETIKRSELCFSGRNTAAEVSEMGGEFAMRGVQKDCPAAVSVLGYRGDVRDWGRNWGLEVQDNWKEWGMIPGLMGKTRLVYPHIYGGRIRYLSGRNILGAEINKEGREVKSFNLPKELAGDRQAYYNHEYAPRAEGCVVVEGQADAITLGQWGLASCGDDRDGMDRPGAGAGRAAQAPPAAVPGDGCGPGWPGGSDWEGSGLAAGQPFGADDKGRFMGNERAGGRMMYRKYALMWVLVIGTMALQGCAGANSAMLDGQVLELGAGATAKGLNLALKGAANTHLISDGKLIFALWPQGEIWGGACINCAVKDPIGQFQYLTGGRGMAMSWKTASELTRDLIENHGWRAMPLANGPMMANWAQMGTALTGFLVVPFVPGSIPAGVLEVRG